MSGFELTETLYIGSDWGLYAATSLATGQQGLLRLLFEDASEVRKKHVLSRARLFSEPILPGFASVLASGETAEGRAFVFMEGQPQHLLCRRLRSQTHSLADVMSAAHQAAQILVQTLATGILYLDLRSDTILWETGPATQGPSSLKRIRLLPGDIVRFQRAATSRQSTLSEESFPSTTPAMRPYQPEEQRSSGLALDERTMVYSLGALIYELLCGHPPKETGPIQLSLSIAEDKSREQLQAYLHELMGRMLSRGIVQRPMLSELTPHLSWLAAMSELLSGVLLGGRYNTERLLALGGMGAVFLAADTRFSGPTVSTRVAVKVPYPQFGGPRIEQEIEAVIRAGKSSPDIVEIFDRGWIPDVGPYIVMRYLEGELLSARLARVGGKLSERDALHIGRHLALALEAVHRQKIIHRDLKPDNVMIVADPALPSRERYKLLDFGIARVGSEESFSGRRLTSVGMRMGTPNYMAPEQIADAAGATDRADVYSLGALLYELVGGKLPAIPPLRWIGSPSFMLLLTRMLAIEAKERPSMTEVQQRLLRIQNRKRWPAIGAAVLGTGALLLSWLLLWRTSAHGPSQSPRGTAAAAPEAALRPGVPAGPAAASAAVLPAASPSPSTQPLSGVPKDRSESPSGGAALTRVDQTLVLPRGQDHPLSTPPAPPATVQSRTMSQGSQARVASLAGSVRSEDLVSAVSPPIAAASQAAAAAAPSSSPGQLAALAPAAVGCREAERIPFGMECFDQTTWSLQQRQFMSRITKDVQTSSRRRIVLCPGEALEITRPHIAGLIGVPKDKSWLVQLYSKMSGASPSSLPQLPLIIRCK